jgi:hypothetical protein
MSFKLDNINVTGGMYRSGPPMTLERLKTISEQIDTRMWPARMEFKISREELRSDAYLDGGGPMRRAGEPMVRVQLTYHVTDRATGKPMPLLFLHTLPESEIRNMDDAAALNFLHTQVRSMVLHELDECFVVCGKRVFDPHGNDAPKAVTYRQAERWNEREPWTLPDPLPPKLPRELPPSPAGERITIPCGRTEYEFLRTGEIVRERRDDSRFVFGGPMPQWFASPGQEARQVVPQPEPALTAVQAVEGKARR